MTSVSLALLVVLAAPGTVARRATPAPAEAPAGGDVSQQAPALSDAEVEERIQSYLGAIHASISPAQWKELGTRAVPVLESTVHDPQALPSRRARAVDALSMIGGARAKKVVLETARAEDEPFGVRAAALRAAPRVLSAKELSRELRPILENAKQSPVRATAADVLVRHGGSSACGAVRAQVDRERRDDRAQFSRAVARCPSQP